MKTTMKIFGIGTVILIFLIAIAPTNLAKPPRVIINPDGTMETGFEDEDLEMSFDNFNDWYEEKWGHDLTAEEKAQAEFEIRDIMRQLEAVISPNGLV